MQIFVKNILKHAKIIQEKNTNYLSKTLLFNQSLNDHVFTARTLSKFPLKVYNIKNQMNFMNKINLFNNTKVMNYSQESSSFHRLQSIELARQFIGTLNNDERLIIKEQLLEFERIQNENLAKTKAGNAVIVARPTWQQLSLVCLQCGLPFIGFGFVDNFLMIIAGDFIENSIGFVMPISTMAAAGLGNAVSDVAGIGLAHHIEGFTMKFVKIPELTPEQWNLGIVNWLTAISKSLCIFVGCVIGMAPLLFMNHNSDEKDKKTEEKTSSSSS